MIIFINGPFGVGKTSGGYLLSKEISDSMIFNPEEVGYMVRKITEVMRFKYEETDDFQDIELWKNLVVSTARELINQYGKHLIIPMTVYKDRNYKYISKGLEALDSNYHHFCLIASNRIDKCLKAFESNIFSKHIDTDNLSIHEVASEILNSI